MPRQQAIAGGPPYTKVLSALRKTELIRLCGEFHLHADGGVVILRNRLKDYLNLHRDAVYQNPRYRPLFPKHRRINQPAASPTPSLSPTPSEASAQSFGSWNGIYDLPVQDPIPPVQPIIPAQQALLPQEPPDLQFVPPPLSVADRFSISPPPALPEADGRELDFLSLSLIRFFLFHIFSVDTMESCLLLMGTMKPLLLFS